MATKKVAKKKGRGTVEDLWAREWQIQLGYDNDPNLAGGGAVLRDPNKDNIFKLVRMTTSGLKAKAYRAIPVTNSTTDYWKNAVFFEMGSKTLRLPTVKGLSKPYPAYTAPPLGTQPPASQDAIRNHINLLDACLKKVEKNTLRLVAGIPVSKTYDNQTIIVVEYILLYCIKNALQKGKNKKKKHLMLIDLRDTSLGAGGPNQSGTGSGQSSRP